MIKMTLSLDEIYEKTEFLNSLTGPPANCIGTSLYLAGLTEKDGLNQDLTGVYDNYLKKLEFLKKPQLCSLVSWEKIRKRKNNIEVVHLGIVSSLSPLKVIHRQGTWGSKRNGLVVESFFEDVNKTYSGFSDSVSYYTPYN